MNAPRLQLLPAVDIAGGRAVQLVQGVAGSGGDFGDPLDAALACAGAGRLTGLGLSPSAGPAAADFPDAAGRALDSPAAGHLTRLDLIDGPGGHGTARLARAALPRLVRLTLSGAADDFADPSGLGGAAWAAGLTHLDDAGRVQELSRMLAGLESSDLAAAHARELLEVAQQTGSRPGAARPGEGT